MATDQQFAEPPVNVRVEHADGSYTPVECVYSGNRRGIYHWNAIREVVLTRGDRKAWDQMPENTECHLYPTHSADTA